MVPRFEVQLMPAEHIGLDGKLRHGYFCSYCGEPCNMVGSGHGPDKCKSDPEKVKKLTELNK